MRTDELHAGLPGADDADAELEKRLQKYTGTKDWKKEKAMEGKAPKAAKGAGTRTGS